MEALRPQFRTKQDRNRLTAPRGIKELSARVTTFEDQIRRIWDRAKRRIPNRREQAVQEFINELVALTTEHYETDLPAIIGVDELTDAQALIAQEQLETQIGFIQTSLQPAILARLREDFDSRSLAERLIALDHRVIAMYAGALWSAGSLLFAMFDGVQARDMAALFMFIGPDDDKTCRGARGCHQYANGIFPLAQILFERIIPGQLQCLTNCRHFLLPIVRIPAPDQRTQFERDVAEMLEREGLG